MDSERSEKRPSVASPGLARISRRLTVEASSRLRNFFQLGLGLAAHTTAGLVGSDIADFAPIGHAVAFALPNREELQDFKTPVGLELSLEFPFAVGEPRVRS